MSQKVTVALTDDLDGSPGKHTLDFGLEGRGYEIDLSDENAERLRAALAPFIDAGRKTGRVGAVKAASRSQGGGENRRPPKEAKAIRAWGRANGYKVADRGKIEQSVLDGWDKLSADERQALIQGAHEESPAPEFSDA